MININIEENKFWKKNIINKNVFIWLKGYIYSHTIEQIKQNIEKLSKKDIISFIKSLDGHFALVIQKEEFTFIAVDKIRTTPLFFTKIDDSFYIDYDPKNLVQLE
ncbi:MAG: asparagine synthase, partial [Sulfurimonas sp.]|nr:asparagine synthase [Sulfurimonas sp.]